MNDTPHLWGMTVRRERRYLRTPSSLRMYIISTKGIEDHPTDIPETGFRSGDAVTLNSISAPVSLRSDDTSPAVILTEAKASRVASDAFQIRWTSLAA